MNPMVIFKKKPLFTAKGPSSLYFFARLWYLINGMNPFLPNNQEELV